MSVARLGFSGEVFAETGFGVEGTPGLARAVQLKPDLAVPSDPAYEVLAVTAGDAGRYGFGRTTRTFACPSPNW